MCRIGVVVYTTEERRRSILADHAGDVITAAGMLVHERPDIVDEASNDDQRTLLSLLLDWRDVSQRWRSTINYTHSSPS